MKKSYVRVVAAFLVCGMIVCGGTNVMASEKQEISDRATAISMTNYLKTVKDSKGNKYSIVGASDRVGKQAAVSTSFAIKYYGDGKTTAIGYTKKMSASAKVGMSGGANNSLSKSYSKSGAKQATVRAGDTYLYNVTLVSGTHSFSCNGASCKGYSNNY